jgi:hypothetical protein
MQLMHTSSNTLTILLEPDQSAAESSAAAAILAFAGALLAL